jgi:serine/threonine protein kinase/WD40 repeat protein
VTEQIHRPRPRPTAAEEPPAVDRGHKGERVAAAEDVPPTDANWQPYHQAAAPADVTPVTSATGTDNNYPVIDGYEVLGELGRGGMGVVYKARQLGLNRIVALKMVLGGPFAEPEFRARFHSEAEAVARLHHPNIVQVYAIGTQESQLGAAFACPFFVQEYMDAGNLAGRLNGAPQPAADAARFVETLARAVHYAHENGIIHRDLKPANILLRGTGGDAHPPAAGATLRLAPAPLAEFEPKIGDFGLAKHLDGVGGPRTSTGVAVGTPEYMAPEQAVGNWPVGPAVDIYALGVILYEMLTGRRPFQGATPLETLELSQSQEPVTLRRLQPAIPRDLETVCLKCLRKEPPKRYANALALADDLRRFRDGETILARPVSRPERVWRWARRRPAVAALTAAVILTAVGGVAGITVAWLHALAGWGTAERRQEDAETNLYFSRIVQARLEGRLGNPATATQLLDRYLSLRDGVPDRRGWEWHYLKGILNADLLTIPDAHASIVFDLTFSRDGQRLATAGGSPYQDRPPDRTRLWQVWGPTAGQCLRDFPHPTLVFSVAYADDDRLVAWSGEDAVGAAEAESGKVVLTRPLPEGCRRAVFSPDGRRYAAVNRDTGQAHVWELTSGRELLVTKGGNPVNVLSFSHDGERLAVSGANILRLWDIGSARELRAVPHPQSNGSRCRPAFSPDGKLVAHAANNVGLVRIWDTTAGEVLHVLAGHTGSVLSVAFSPDGRQLATAGADGTVRVWSTQSGNEVLQLHGHQGRIRSLAFHPSGRYLASGGEQPSDVKVWDLTRHQEYVSVTPVGPGRVEAVGFVGDGTTLRAVRSSGTLQTADAATGVERATKRVDLAGKLMVPAAVAAFSPDGRRLATVSRGDTRIVKVVDADTVQEQFELKHRVEVLYVGFSRDGRRIVTSGADRPTEGNNRREIAVWDAETGARLMDVACDPCQPGRGTFGAAALSPDGRELVYDEYSPRPGGAAGTDYVARVSVRNLDTGQTQEVVSSSRSKTRQMAFSADGRHLAVTFEEDGVHLCDWTADRWQPRPVLGGSVADNFYDMAFSPDGRRLAAVSRVQVLIWEVATGQMVLDLRGAPPRPSDNAFNPHVAWSPDGRRLAASNWNGSVSIWDTAARDTPAAKQALYAAAEERARRP